MRRALIIIAIVIVLAGAGAAAYFYFFAGGTAGITTVPGGSTSLPVAGVTAPGPGAGSATASTSTSPTSAPTIVSARLVKISAGPVVPGEIITDIKKATASSSAETTINYVERQSGNLYSYLVNARTNTRISNRTIPGIQSATWFPNASSTIVRYLSGADFSTINSYVLPVNGSVGSGFFLPQNLSDAAVSVAGILTLTSGGNGSVASLARADGTHASQVFTTPLSALRISFAGKNQYLAFTKPSARLPGVAFLVDAAGRFSRVAGPLSGLVALASPSGKWLLVSYANGGTMQMELVNTASNAVLPLPVSTIADKCAWTADDSAVYCGIPVEPSPNFNYPDDWYQGAVSFSDRIWKIQVSGRYAQLVLDFSTANSGALDAEALAVNPLNTVLSFVNKNDGSLWSYQL
ncbi:MAG: hypothetical protein Q7R59_02645 [bacterium]|nr:hypothetical protein [bacterium]